MLKVGDKVHSSDMTKLGEARRAGYNVVLNRKCTKVRFMSKDKAKATIFAQENRLDRFGTFFLHSEIPTMKAITQTDVDWAMNLHYRIAESRNA